MESDAKAELIDVERLGRKARLAASDYPRGASLLITVADLVLIGVFIAFGLSTPMIIGWVAFLAVFHVALRMRRPARPRAPWATPESRRRSLKMLALDVAVNALWIPLFFIARPVALGLLIAVLLYSLFASLKYRHA
jgi:hypothetical protein